ncbi:hypothetical protein SOQ14_01755 [Erythrobacter sp. T5W1-R]|uniref:hypothetical protein n=1 Tax=Erythrobacter sp. T5W1-R TaxID=3101752 RepID=UPI002AFDE42B|nr:hypothetical protein [Erythrobacter sp. T5W1-R]MEA1617632.1 hypothetical protein [Erythrobacter sp. T5W1-R]
MSLFVHYLASIDNSLAGELGALSHPDRDLIAARGGLLVASACSAAGMGEFMADIRASAGGLVLAAAVLALVAACQSAPAEAPADAAPGEFVWPTSLKVVGDGYPGPGAPCRRIGESTATIDFLDDSAALVGCPSVAEADKLGGKVLATIDGVTLISVPNDRAATPGDGDGQGDALVAGTNYNATAQIRCAGHKGAAAAMCDAGVIRSGTDGTTVEVMLPGGVKRAIFFNPDGSFLTFSTAEADGTAAMTISSTRKGDTTIARLGSETYEVPDAFVTGD